ncbi:hypothetical protein HYFRA_00009561 [Hymenoscyphus fraxineus]|uniref:SprT-like domain-containing protein n=1 Tax=Hymenoscyphus fraxineus TaxID=746836 RepID=A0A9N9L0Z7_9HELO|nr:hypothetical protein HYFRA_00009561 [Hymenoscyphus fraxineus]
MENTVRKATTLNKFKNIVQKATAMNRLKKMFSKRRDRTGSEVSPVEEDYEPPACSYECAPDGRKIYQYQELSIEKVLPPKHPRIFDDWKKAISSNPRPLEKFSYCPLEFGSFLKIPHITHKFTAEQETLLSSAVPEVKTTTELANLLITWFDLFDTWLFGGTLSNTDLVIENSKTSALGRGWYYNPTNTVHIQLLDKTLGSEPGFTGSNEHLFIGTLLHEMVHAFIYLYSCPKYCCNVCFEPQLGGRGKFGHGPVWADSLTVLSEVLGSKVSWPVFVNIPRSIANSMCLEDWQPTQAQLEFWGMDVDEWGRFENWSHNCELTREFYERGRHPGKR